MDQELHLAGARQLGPEIQALLRWHDQAIVVRGEPQYRRGGKQVRHYDGDHSLEVAQAQYAGFMDAWSAWRDSAPHDAGWFGARPFEEQAVANAAKRVAGTFRDRLRTATRRELVEAAKRRAALVEHGDPFIGEGSK